MIEAIFNMSFFLLLISVDDPETTARNTAVEDLLARIAPLSSTRPPQEKSLKINEGIKEKWPQR
jgi:hypothetical protein